MKKQISFFYLKLFSFLFLIIGFIIFVKFAFYPDLAKGIIFGVCIVLFSVLYRVGEKKSVFPEGYSVNDALSFYRTCVLNGHNKSGYHNQMKIIKKVSQEYDVFKSMPIEELLAAYRKSEKIYKEVKIPDSLFFGSKGGKNNV